MDVRGLAGNRWPYVCVIAQDSGVGARGRGAGMATVSRRYATGGNAFERPSGRLDVAARGPVVLMVSGGADSTALLVLAATSELDIDDGRGCARIARERLHVLHVNHELRGFDAQEDEEFVRGLCDRLGVPCTVEHVDVRALATSPGSVDSNVENVAREVRYAAAGRLANELCEAAGLPRGAARIVTAHTANDRTETFFMNAIKGSGTQGLSSIPRRRNRIVRPLLDRTHDELCDLLRMRGIVWREDDTNADTRYLRAYVRHEIVPLALSRNPRLMENMATTCDILSDEDAFLTQLASRTLRTIERRREEGYVVLDAAKLAATEVVVARRVVRMAVLAACPQCRLEAKHVARILKIVAAGTGSVTVPMGVDARVAYGALFLRARSASPDTSVSGWLEVPGLEGVPAASTTLAAPGPIGGLSLGEAGTVTARLREVGPGSDPVALALAHAREWEGTSVLLDAQACHVPLLGGRLWVDMPQPGDVLCPFGMHGQSKKLSDLLIDAKVPAAERRLMPVVRVSCAGPILWVAPLRADERARVTASSRVLVELHFHPRGE